MTCLLQHGAQLDVTDGSGRTPLMHAVISNHGTAAALLCDYGANVRARVVEQHALCFARRCLIVSSYYTGRCSYCCTPSTPVRPISGRLVFPAKLSTTTVSYVFTAHLVVDTVGSNG